MSEFELDNQANGEAEQKQAGAYLFAQSSVGKAATGVLSGLAVSQTATASGSVLVAPGAGVAQAAVLDGVSLLVNNTSKTLDVLVANPVGSLPRIDSVVFDAATTSVRAIIGTPSATPSPPTLPSSAVLLAQLRQIQSGQPGYGTIPTSAIDDLRTFTSLALGAAVSGTFTPTAGFYDTPSLSYSLNGTVASTTPGLGVVLKAGNVTLNGNIRRTGASFSNADTLLGNVPDGFRPATVQRGTVVSGASSYTLVVLTNGDVWLVNATLATSNSVVPHLSWPVA